MVIFIQKIEEYFYLFLFYDFSIFVSKIIKMNQRTCRKCKQTKDETLFAKNYYLNTKHPYQRICKDCKKEENAFYKKEYDKNHRDESKQFQRKWRKIEKIKSQTPEGIPIEISMKRCIRQLRHHTKQRSFQKNLPFDLDADFIMEKLLPMKCAVTGLDLSFLGIPGVRVNPCFPSMDRIDSSKGYTKDNVRVVCFWYNVAKQDFSEEMIISLLKKTGNHLNKEES